MAFAGFTRRKKGTISNGDWDRDGVINRKDCEPLNFRKQGAGHKPRCDTCGAYNKKLKPDRVNPRYKVCQDCIDADNRGEETQPMEWAR